MSLRSYCYCLGILRLLSRLRLFRSRCLLGGRLAHVAGMLLLLLVLLASGLLGRRRLYLRCLSLSLFGRRLRGLGLFRVLVGVFVMAPERDFCEAAMVLLILTFVGIVPASLGHHQRAEQHQADHKAQGSSDCFTHKASRFRELCSG